MDVYQEAVDYLESHNVPVVEPEPEPEPEPDGLEEDEFSEESGVFSPLQVVSFDFSTMMEIERSPEEMLEKRLTCLKGILESEEVYLRELDALLMPMKALWASAGTSQPVLSSQQVQTVFYQVPEIRDMHQSFYSGLKARLNGRGEGSEEYLPNPEMLVGDLFLKMVNQFGLYGGFIGNYEDAVDVVRKCSNLDPRFRTLAESMMSHHNGTDKTRTKYTFEALLYKPLDRVTKTTLVLHDVLKTTPAEHGDYASLQEALRLSRSFLSGVNESSQSKRGVTLSHSVRRQLIRDGFVVDPSEGERALRHLFLYTDLLLCTKFKQAGKGKPDQYRFCWYLPLSRLKLRWVAEQSSPDELQRLHSIRTRMYLLRQYLEQHGTRAPRVLVARGRKRLEQRELRLLTLSAGYRLELNSPSSRTQTLLFSSLYDLEEWREAIHNLTTDVIETVPPDLLTLTSTCVKLRMTQQPPLQSSSPAAADQESLCGTLSVAVHSASGLQDPACVFVCVEVDGYEFHDKQAQTHSSVHSLSPHWDQELSFQVDGARQVKVLCVSQAEGQDDAVLGKTLVQLEPKSLEKQWRRRTLTLGQVKLSISLKFSAHLAAPPDSSARQQPVFCVPIQAVAQQEGVLVPHVVRCCVEEVERRGMDEVGIYRISGSANDINALKAAFNNSLREAVTMLRSADVNVVSGVLKLYFRELPESLMPTELFRSLATMLEIPDMKSRLDSLLSVLDSCPDTNRHTFLYLLHHLQRVSEKQAINKMSPMNLATVFGPSLLRPPADTRWEISQEVVVQVQVVFWYLQCNNLPEAKTSLQHDTDAEDDCPPSETPIGVPPATSSDTV